MKTTKLLAGALLPLTSAAVLISSAGAASAQTALQADVTATLTRPAGPCSNGALYCGTADIAGYGAASWNLYATGYVQSPTSCGSTYTATTDFTLTSDGSTLVLNEIGYICFPGNDGAGALSEGPNAFGHPNFDQGAWTVDTADSTGQFAGLGGSGTDTLQVAGAYVSGSYTGLFGP